MGCGGGLRGKEGILWGMPGESQGTLRAAPCACVELISSPLPLLPSSHPSVPSPSFAFPSAGSARGEHGVPRDLAPLPLRAHSPSSSSSLRLFLHHSLFVRLSPYLTLTCRRSLSFAVVSSSFSSSLYGSFSFLRCCVLHSRYWHPLIKPSFPHSPSLSSICLHLALYLHLSFFSSFRSLHLHVWHVFLFPSRSPSFSLSTFYVPRLIFPIERPLIKLYFVSPCEFSEHFGESRFHGAHAVAIACLVGSRSMMSNSFEGGLRVNKNAEQFSALRHVFHEKNHRHRRNDTFAIFSTKNGNFERFFLTFPLSFIFFFFFSTYLALNIISYDVQTIRLFILQR